MTLKTNDTLAGATARVQRDGIRVPIRRNGRVVAAVVSAEDLKILQAMDRMDALAHKQALARARKRGEKPVSLAQAKKMLGV